MKRASQIALAMVLGTLAWGPSIAKAAAPVTTAEYRSGDTAVEVTPVRGYRPYGAYYRPYCSSHYGFRSSYGYRPNYYQTYRNPYAYGSGYDSYRPPYYYGYRYPGTGGYYGGPGFYFGYRW